MRSRDTPRPGRIVLLATVAVALAGASSGQVTNMDVNSDFPYTFLPPGARSVGMGGAFTALADDATAAWSNPAGLLHLSRPEVSVELQAASPAISPSATIFFTTLPDTSTPPHRLG